MADDAIGRLLREWSALLLRCDDLRASLPADAVKRKWAGNAPASDASIAAAELRLGVALPADLRRFYQHSDGWPCFDDGRRILAIDELERVANLQPDLVESCVAWRPASGDVDGMIPASHFPSLIQLTADDDGFYLLDPRDSARKSWESYFFANWVPGEEPRGTFAELLRSTFEAFRSARGLAAPGRSGRKPLKLNRPPSESETDPRRWAASLADLGYFDRMSDAARTRAIEAFVSDVAQMAADPQRMYRDHFAPMRQLLVAETGRVAWVEASDDVAADPSRVEQDVRRLLDARGVSLPPMTEERRDVEWRVSFGDASARVTKLKAGKPSGLGMQHPQTITAAIVNAIATSMTRRLAADGADDRIATISDFSTGADASRTNIRHGLIVLDDALSYELMWTSLGGCYCRVVRPDVF